MALEEGEIVLCTVERIEKANVFVKIDAEGSPEGTIVMSEIASGRIRNIRDYVVLKKKIVCKILRIASNHIDLSLRRVNEQERKQILDQFKEEQSYKSILKGILKEDSEKIISSIEKKSNLYEFLQNSKENPSMLEKEVGKEKAAKILEVLNLQKKKIETIKENFSLKTTKSNGIEIIKEILSEIKDAKITYVSAGKFIIKADAKDKKTADKKIRENLQKIEQLAKKHGVEFNA